MKIKNIAALTGLMMSCLGVFDAEGQELNVRDIKVDMDMRADFQYNDIKGEESKSGFHGRYFNLMVNGSISKELSFSWRQRLNKYKDSDGDVFSATDWVYLNYRPIEQFSIAAGKQVVMIGGYEYDAAPIDIFFASRFWNNIACYQFGASATWHLDNDKHQLSLQMCNSPYQNLNSSCYAYNLFWQGHMGWFHTLWSVNMIEYTRGHYANFIALGNQAILGPLDLQVDLMNRATSHHKYWFADYSIIAKAEYNVTPWLTLMVKGGKDDFRAMPGAPEHLNKPFVGGGLEFFPYHGSRNLRIHALYDNYHENDGTRVSQVLIGLKWKVNLFKRSI